MARRLSPDSAFPKLVGVIVKELDVSCYFLPLLVDDINQLSPEASSPPELSFNVTSGTYIIVSVDLDAPFQSFSILSPVLHWIQSGLTPETAEDGPSVLKPHDTPVIVNYAGPGPPPGSGPHRYVFLLYEQPEGFDVSKYAPAGGKPTGIGPRVRYDLGAFETKAKLGPVIAANYFNSN